MQQPQHPLKNHLLAALPASEFERLEIDLVLVPMPAGQVLYEAGNPLHFVHFPTTAIVSLLYAPVDGVSAEIAVVGNEGMLGIALVMGGATPLTRAVVQYPGWGYRLSAQQIQNEFWRGGALMVLLLRYAQALITHMTQTVTCNRLHSIEQQLARWLLLSLDRRATDSLTMTPDQIADMVGMRGENVSDAAAPLERAGLIRYACGHIQVLNRRELERRACTCYSTVRQGFDRLLSDIPPGAQRGLLGKPGPTGATSQPGLQ